MKKLLFLITILFSQSVFATSSWFLGTIRYLYPTANGDVVVVFNEDNPKCTNASNPKYHYLVVGQNSVTKDGKDTMYSALLTAAASKKKVSINFDSDSDSCYINRLIVRFDS